MKNSYCSLLSIEQLFRNKVLSFLLIGFSFCSFHLKAQNQTKEYFQTKLKSNTTVGYLSYLPPAYASSGNDFPLMIFLHGMGETGNDLNKLLYYGPPNLIHWGKWPTDRPLIVISPQNPSAFGSSWSPALVDEVINEVSAKYRVDKNRIYVTGTSMGGNGAWNYATTYPEKVAALVPICGWGTPSNACNMKNVPTWAFHNSGDPTVNVSGTTNMIDAIEKCSPSPWPKETIYQKSGHDAWSMTYDLTAGHDIYSWMLSYSKSGSTTTNKTPSVNAGSDKTLTLPQNSISLAGSATDSDGSVSSYAWSKISGPSVSMANTSSSTVNLTNLVAGTYYFRLTVKDNKGASAYDDVKVEVNSAPITSPPADGQGLHFKYYEGTWDKLPYFASLSPKKTGSVSNFTLSPKSRNDNYSFEFDGYLEISTEGNYLFYSKSDDGSKIYINGKEIVNNDGLHGEIERSGSVYLTPGKQAIKVTYFEKTGGDVLSIRYSGPGISKQLIPDSKLFLQGDDTSKPPVEGDEGLIYKYYEGDWTALPNFSALTPKKSGSIQNFSLSPKNQQNNYAFLFEGFITVNQAGNYNFFTSSDDGSKLYINDKEIVNNDGLHGKVEKTGTVYLSSGQHKIKVTYFERWSDDILEVRYSGPGVSKQLIPNSVLSSAGDTSSKPATPITSSGVNYSYYEGNWTSLPNFSNLKAKKSGTISNFSLAPKLINNTYAFKYDAFIDIKTAGTYSFYISSDDGSKLSINDSEIINNDGLHQKTEKSSSVYLGAGKHKIQVLYFEQWGDDILEVKYSGPGISKQIIPNDVLSTDDSGSTTANSESSLGTFTKSIEEATGDDNFENVKTNVFPNPFSETLNISFSGPYSGLVAITLMDISGKTVFRQEMSVTEFENKIKLDFVGKDIRRGLYLLQLNYGMHKEVIRIIKE